MNDDITFDACFGIDAIRRRHRAELQNAFGLEWLDLSARQCNLIETDFNSYDLTPIQYRDSIGRGNLSSYALCLEPRSK